MRIRIRTSIVFAVPGLVHFLVFAIAIVPIRLDGGEGAAPEITGKLEKVEGASVLRLWGSPRERGFAHGWLLAEQIVEEAEEGFSTAFSGRAEAYEKYLLPLLTAGFSFSVDETAEMEGMVDGIGKRLPERKVKPFGRLLNLADIKLINTYGDWYCLSCSSAAVWGKFTADGKPAAVRNFDFMPLASITRWQHVRAVAPAGGGKARGWVGIAMPGSLGPVTAMNEEGVFTAIHDVWVRPSPKDYIQGNVPRLIALRRLLEELPARGAVEKAAELCRSWNTLFGNNFIVATPGAGPGLPAGILEYDTREEEERGVTLRGPDAGASGEPLEYLVCSNGHRRRGKDSCGRYDSLVACCRGKSGRFDIAALEDLARSAAVPAAGKPVAGNGIGTLHQAVALTGERKLRVLLLESREKNIRDSRGIEFRVDDLLGAMPRAEKKKE